MRRKLPHAAPLRLSQHQCNDPRTRCLTFPQPLITETQPLLSFKSCEHQVPQRLLPYAEQAKPSMQAGTLRSRAKSAHCGSATGRRYQVGARFSAPAARLPRTARAPAFRADVAAPAAAPAPCRLLRSGGVARAGGAASAPPAPASSPPLPDSPCAARHG